MNRIKTQKKNQNYLNQFTIPHKEQIISDFLDFEIKIASNFSMEFLIYRNIH